MITPIQTPWEPGLWRSELRQAIRSSAELLAFVGVSDADELAASDFPTMASSDFPTMVPRGFAARMQPGNRQDPLLRQVLAVSAEQQDVAGFVADPLQENTSFSSTPGLIHKYKGRALLITNGACAINCRYCFRRHFPYAEHRPSQLQGALDTVAADASIEEIILSGGDPLLLDDDALGRLVDQLADIDHLQRLRIHSRIPVVLPERVTEALLRLLQNCRLRCVMVIHANHGNELDDTTARALSQIAASGTWLLNQTVLLRGVNDSAASQIALAKALFSQGVQPYYLHMPDRVAGTAHFYVDDAAALTVYRDMQANLPGYLLPKLVREVPGDAAKRIVSG